MRNPFDMSREELVAVATALRNALYLDRDGTLDPDREINGGDLVEELCLVAERFDLVPGEPTPRNLADGGPFLRKHVPGETKITCPHCGFDGSAEPKEYSAAPFRIVEDLSCLWPVVSVNPDGTINADADAQETDYENYVNTRVCCSNCLREFPVPEGATVNVDSFPPAAADAPREA